MSLKFPNRPDQDLAWYQMNVGPDRYGWPKQLGHLCLSTCYGCVFQRVLKVQMKDIYGHAKQIPNRASLHRPAWDYNPNQNCNSEMKRTQTRSSYWRIIYTSIGRRSVNNQQTKKSHILELPLQSKHATFQFVCAANIEHGFFTCNNFERNFLVLFNICFPKGPVSELSPYLWPHFQEYYQLL